MASERERSGVVSLRDALFALTAGQVSAPGPLAVVLDLAGGARVQLEATVLALADANVVARRLDQWTRALGGGALGVVVADRVTAGAREMLNAAGWGWLDLRGHLRIVGPGIVIDTDVPSARAPVAARSAFSGEVGRELAALLLLTPDQPTGVRAVAAALSRAPSSVSAAFTALGADGLVTADRTPERPELFWALAEHWVSPHVDVASLPTRGREDAVLGVQLDEQEGTSGWALTDTVAAVAYSAPVGARGDHPPDFVVPDHATLRRAVQLLGPAPIATTRAARLRVAPVPAVCSQRVDGASRNQEWPLAQPLFVALDLAQDPGRGREILDAWTPPEPWRRVW